MHILFAAITAAAVTAVAATAVAEDQTTLQAVTSKGIVMKAFGLEIPVAYSTDGKWTAQAPGSKVTGAWTIKGGDTLCTTTTTDPAETCAVYPAGKKSGDTFDVPGAMGAAMGVISVRIN